MFKLLRYNFKDSKVAYLIELVVMLTIDLGILSLAFLQRTKGVNIISISFYPEMMITFAYVNFLIVIFSFQRQVTKDVGRLYFSASVKGINYLISKVFEFCIIQGFVIIVGIIYSSLFNNIFYSEYRFEVENLIVYSIGSVLLLDLLICIVGILTILSSMLKDYKRSTIISIMLIFLLALIGLIVNNFLGNILPKFVINIRLLYYSKFDYLNIFIGAYVRNGVLKVTPIFMAIKLGFFIMLFKTASKDMDDKLDMTFNN